MAMKWYIVNTHSGCENRAKLSLEERIKSSDLKDKFGEVLIPVETTVENRKGGKRQTTRKFFPGYMLVQMELTDETWHLVKGTAKVSGFVGGTTEPPSMSDAEVERIIGKMNKTVEKTDLAASLELKDTVRVLDGPFVNFSGTVESLDRDKSRLCVLVSILGRVVPVELDFSQVEKVNA
ncbi:MAG: transcription termination/antitermination protein NusG [Proteobacteria bacterium]|nr:transcription termination/antitermination protein NusG [Pseudomonadota bacterium]MBQ9816723.1 transcription termination/antitermination protein NusG [Pseudomonadota bacterium]